MNPGAFLPTEHLGTKTPQGYSSVTELSALKALTKSTICGSVYPCSTIGKNAQGSAVFVGFERPVKNYTACTFIRKRAGVSLVGKTIRGLWGKWQCRVNTRAATTFGARFPVCSKTDIARTKVLRVKVNCSEYPGCVLYSLNMINSTNFCAGSRRTNS